MKNLIQFALLVFAVVVFVLLATKVIDTDTGQWLDGAFAAFAASFLPWPSV